MIPLTEAKIKKQALLPLLLGIGAILGVGAAAAAGINKMLGGIQTNISDNAKQLHDRLVEWLDKYPKSSALIQQMVEESEKLQNICDKMLEASNHKAEDSSAVQDFHDQLKTANLFVSSLEGQFQNLESRETIYYAPTVSGPLTNVKDGLAKFEQSLTEIGQNASRQKTEQPGEEIGNTGFTQVNPPLAVPSKQEAPPSPLSEQEKSSVIGFLNQNWKPGITLVNLDDELDALALQMQQSLGVKVPEDRLRAADINKMRKLFQVWKDPGSAVGYFAGMKGK